MHAVVLTTLVAVVIAVTIDTYIRTRHRPKPIASMTDRKEDDYEVYHCGWTFITADFKLPCPFSLSRLRNIDSENPPANAYFAIIHNKCLSLYDSEAQRQLFGEIQLRESVVRLHPVDDLPVDEYFVRELPITVTRNNRTIYLYTSSPNEKEDWFVALRRASEVEPKGYNIEQERLIRQDYFTNTASQLSESGDLAWLNAIIARLLYQQIHSKELITQIKEKFLRRLALSPIPFFVGKVDLQEVNLGNCPPFILHGLHHYTNQSGETMVSVDVQYSPPLEDALSVTIHATCKLDTAVTGNWTLPVTMTITVLHLSGTVQVWIKAAPGTDRLWFGFTREPKVQIVVNTDSVGLNAVRPVLRAAVGRVIKEVIADGFTVPFYADSPLPPGQFGDCTTTYFV